MMGQGATGSTAKFNFNNAYPTNTFSDNLPPPHGYNFGGGSGADPFGVPESCGPSNASGHHRVARGTVAQSSKESNLTRYNI